MVNVPQVERKSIAGRTLVGLAVVAIIFALVTVSVVYKITHNLYISGYYTISSLFDAIGINVGPALEALAPPFSSNFDELIAISIIDGIGKIIAVGLALAAIVEILTSANILTRVNVFAARRLRGHVIVCGYSRISERLCNELAEKKMKFVVLDNDQTVVDTLGARNYIAIRGDYTSEEALNNADIKNARAVVFAAQNDVVNLLGIVTARHLNPKIKILARVTEEDLMTKMQRAGAELCVVPEILAGIELGGYIRSKVR